MRRPSQRFTNFVSAIILAILITLPTLAFPPTASFAKEHIRSEVFCGTFTSSSLQAQLQSVSADINDWDGDGLTDTTETERSLTNPCSPDTDEDGLLDPWEVDPTKVDPLVDKAGFDLDSNGTVDASRDAVFEPYAESQGASSTIDKAGRLTSPFSLFVHRPDPLHKDIYFELDWQDCTLDPSNCPEPGGSKGLDPTHHAPDPTAIQDVVNTFQAAPVFNPDGTTGINIHILVDERIEHIPNCDRGMIAVRDSHFGTKKAIYT